MSTARRGTPELASTRPSDSKNTPSAAMATRTRGPVSRVDMLAPRHARNTSAARVCRPMGPRVAVARLAATMCSPTVERVTPSKPRTRAYAAFTARYTRVVASVPMTKARGSVRVGSFTSPASEERSDQPS